MSVGSDTLAELSRVADLYEEHAKKMQRLQYKLRSQKVAGYRVQAQNAITVPDLTRLVIYSSNTPDLEDFASMIKCQKAQYDFNTASAETLAELVANMKSKSPMTK